jgi:TRAP-type C4-dicarboxylate transport system permease small subunit
VPSESGISGSTTIVQHLTLVISMLGAAVAARESRLRSLATTTFLAPRWRRRAAVISGAGAASTSAVLAFASLQFVWSERAGAKILAHGIPVWVVQLILPAGFAVIALRLMLRSSEDARGRTIAIAATIAICIAIYAFRFSPSQLAVPVLIALLGAAFLGAPIFVVLGGAALVLFARESVSLAAVVVGHYSLVVNPSLPAIPLFTLAGYVLAEGGASPMGAAFHIDPIHLGIIFLANLELGFLMPPVGLNLLISSYRFGKPMTEVARASFPMVLVLLAGVMLITYVPPLTTWLPHLFIR